MSSCMYQMGTVCGSYYVVSKLRNDFSRVMPSRRLTGFCGIRHFRISLLFENYQSPKEVYIIEHFSNSFGK